MKPHPIICPIRLFENIIENDEQRFKKTLLGPEGDVADFWYHMRGHVLYSKNADRIDPVKSLACGMHGDGAPTTKVDGLFTISWNSLHGEGSTQETRQVFTVMKKSEMCGDALKLLWDRIAWAFNALSVGTMPAKDWQGKCCKEAGRPLAAGWKIAMIHIRGDWEFFSQVMGFPTAQSVPNCCWLCHASPP